MLCSKYEQGIVTISGTSCSLTSRTLVHKDPSTGGEVQHVELAIDKGLPWEDAVAYRHAASPPPPPLCMPPPYCQRRGRGPWPAQGASQGCQLPGLI